MMKEINWADAPEGTTHVGVWLDEARWRKVANNTVYMWIDGRWEDLGYEPNFWLIEFGANIVERPKEPEEAVLPHGLEWPEDATHYCEMKTHKFFMNERNYKGLFTGDEEAWWYMGKDACRFYADKADTIVRFPNGQPKEQPKPIPKKPIGWWT